MMIRAARSNAGIVEIVQKEMPACDAHSLVVKAQYSAISTGTELMTLRGKGTVFMGNSGVGTVVEKGAEVRHVEVGQRIACYGVPAHAEYYSVPKLLAVPVPEHVDGAEAAFTGLGAIAIQALRQADLRFGESAAVVGLGILGQIVAQIAEAAACPVAALDINEYRCDVLRRTSNIAACPSADELTAAVRELTSGSGVDSVLLCAGSPTDTLIDQSIGWLRDRGKVVIVGVPNTTFTRNALFRKEAEIVISRAGGPGRYDPTYEQMGNDYPIGYVRWTEGRNTAEFIRLLADNRLRIRPLISHTFAFDQIAEAYETCINAPQSTLGVLIEYK
ncbi:MAG: hypothetical protein K0Q59_5626 [Paenibacillus sp.]|jgi:threonine dehydrogenase-like Zn-dependent dehydrogenase|nr:hypothetical protein [Paenibacillus sp.]